MFLYVPILEIVLNLKSDSTRMLGNAGSCGFPTTRKHTVHNRCVLKTHTKEEKRHRGTYGTQNELNPALKCRLSWSSWNQTAKQKETTGETESFGAFIVLCCLGLPAELPKPVLTCSCYSFLSGLPSKTMPWSFPYGAWQSVSWSSILNTNPKQQALNQSGNHNFNISLKLSPHFNWL